MKQFITIAVLLFIGATNATKLDIDVAPKAKIPKKKSQNVDFAVGSSKDKKMFSQIDTELDQAARNVAQGEIGRQLGLTKMVGLKMHYKDLGDNINKEIMGIAKLPGADDAANDKKFDEEYKFLKEEGETALWILPRASLTDLGRLLSKPQVR